MKLNGKSLVGQLCLGLIVVQSGCGALSKKETDTIGVGIPASQGTTGCVVGSVYNGLTGDPIAVRAFDGTQGVSVLVRDSHYGAQPVNGASARELSDGFYSVCGIPADEDYPLFVRQEGFQPFTGTIHIDSTQTPKGPAIETHLFKSAPSYEANIVLYPVGTRTQDLVFSVIYAGAPVKGALVELRPTGRNALDKANTNSAEVGLTSRVLAPRDIRLSTLSATSDDNGNATFSKDDLVLGGIYNYVVLPPEALTTASTEIDTTGSVIVGLQASGAGRNPYRYQVILKPMAADLAMLQTSASSQSTSLDGSVSMVFNRPIEIVTQPDAITATLSNAVDAELVTEIPGNRTSDSVEVILSSDQTVLKLIPKFRVAPVAAREPALAVNFSGLQVRPAAAPMNIKILPVAGSTIKLFGAEVNPTLVPTRLQKNADSDNQSGSVSSVLSRPLTVVLLDQFGIALKNQTVTFAVATGSGSIKKVTDSSYTSSVSVVTDSTGSASVNWTLGANAGEQTVTARIGTAEVATFRAVATN
ncbi:MAG: hypothetical protein NT027_12825 [Proteobacteria bacterium]|nr:hypothetical protein [Pseudomonadota bacterium]